MASEPIAHSASWAIDSEPIRARGIIVNDNLLRCILEPRPNRRVLATAGSVMTVGLAINDARTY